MSLASGARLGPYEILAPIGAGGMGEVYRAKDTKLDREVAIKVLPAALAQDRERLARFEREAKVLASLNHPNIAQIYGIEESNGVRALVMELVPGETLKGPLPLETALNYAKQIADALEAAHEKAITHRDLKPANIMVTPEAVVKVLDFGLAAVGHASTPGDGNPTNSTLTMAATQAGMIMGTAAYMSPEQASGKPVDKRADIWSFGVVLWEMLTGERLFESETISHTLASVLKDQPDWNRAPARVRRLLKRCLEKDPKKRLRDIADGMALLEEESHPEIQQQPSSAASSRWPWSVAVAACILAAGLAFTHLREKPPARPEVTRFQIRLPDKVTFTSTSTPALSPDGRHVAFTAFGPDGRAGLWVQDLDALEARAVPDANTGPDSPPSFWSPDSRFVAFSSASSKFRKADLQSGTSQDICDKPGTPVIGGSWNRSGVLILGSTNSGLWRVPAAGGTPVPLTVLDKSRQERQHELPWFLPDGRHFVYLRISVMPEESGIYAGSLDDPPERQSAKRILAAGFGAAYVPSADGNFGRLLFLREGTLMAQTFDPVRMELVGDPAPVAEGVGTVFETGHFAPSANTLVYRTSTQGRYLQLSWFDSRGKVLGTVGDPGPIGELSLSPDGTRVVYRRDSPNRAEADIWLLDLARGVNTRFTFGPRVASSPVWSPDGAEIVFASNRDGVYNLYRKPANGAREEELLLRTNENKRPWSWSRDGRFLLYGTSVSPAFTSNDIWVLPMQGDHKPFPFQQTRFDELAAQFSPDGHWVSYASSESGFFEVYVREFIAPRDSAAAGGKWIVSKGGGMFSQWRADGKELLLFSRARGTATSVSIDTTRSFQAGAPRELFRLPAGTNWATATGDLKRILLSIPVEQRGPQSFTVMLNWSAAPKP
jgi:serine/threonine protein kinase